jgi:hypothetical protein
MDSPRYRNKKNIKEESKLFMNYVKGQTINYIEENEMIINEITNFISKLIIVRQNSYTTFNIDPKKDDDVEKGIENIILGKNIK